MAQRGIRGTLCLFQCVTWGISAVFRKSDLLAVSYPLRYVYVTENFNCQGHQLVFQKQIIEKFY